VHGGVRHRRDGLAENLDDSGSGELVLHVPIDDFMNSRFILLDSLYSV
jgi:hypothetical protein